MRTAVSSSHTDEQLIQEYLNGDNNVLGILYNRFYKKVYYKCLSFTKNADDAFDFAQDILLKSFSKAASFKGESKFSTWLFSITHNYCVSEVARRNKIRPEDVGFRYNLYTEPGNEQGFEERRQREDKEIELYNYMDELSEKDKNILVLKYHQNYSVKELQEVFGSSASAIKMRLMRARQKLEDIYNNHNAA